MTSTRTGGTSQTVSASPIKILDESVLAEAHRQAVAAGKDPRAYLVEKTRLGLMMALGMKADLSMKAAATYLGVHVNSLANYRKRGLLPNLYYVSARKAMIPLTDLENIKQGMASKAKKAA